MAIPVIAQLIIVGVQYGSLRPRFRVRPARPDAAAARARGSGCNCNLPVREAPSAHVVQ